MSLSPTNGHTPTTDRDPPAGHPDVTPGPDPIRAAREAEISAAVEAALIKRAAKAKPATPRAGHGPTRDQVTAALRDLSAALGAADAAPGSRPLSGASAEDLTALRALGEAAARAAQAIPAAVRAEARARASAAAAAARAKAEAAAAAAAAAEKEAADLADLAGPDDDDDAV